MTELLQVRGLSVRYGMIEAVKDVSFAVSEGAIVSLVGANGAGKTTILRTISGLLPPVAGEVFFADQPLAHLPAHEIVASGLAHVPEGRRVFPRMTVRENLDLGAFVCGQGNNIDADLERVHTLFPILAERAGQKAGTLSGGEQQMLAIARALMSRPRLLMLDEPSMGLAPLITQRIFDIVAELREQGTTVLLVEQNAQAALSLADKGYVLESGSVVLVGTGADLLMNEDVRKAYLAE